MGSIQCQIFQRTVNYASLDNLGSRFTAAWNELRTEVNTFLATIPAPDICEVHEHIAQFGTNNQAAHLTIHVYYLS